MMRLFRYQYVLLKRMEESPVTMFHTEIIQTDDERFS